MTLHSQTFEPENFVTFVHASRFDLRWEKLGLSDRDLQKLQIAIMSDPQRSPVIQGTGGLRKLRIQRDGKGKSGGFRVCFVYFEEARLVHLLVVYGKNEKDNLSSSDKKTIRKHIAAIKSKLSTKFFRH